MARQKLGQHFLADAGWREKIARAIGVSRHAELGAPKNTETPWLEIGAGHGEMTEHLLAAGAPVTAIEVDAGLVERLQGLRERYANLTVAASDILQADLGKLLGEKRVRVYGNLPYYITSPILHRLFEHAAQIEAIHIVIQLEVAERLTARPGSREYGYLSVVTQYFSRPEIALRIPRGAFLPAPEITSALVTLRMLGPGATLGIRDETRFFDFVKLCFGQKRKTVVNNLKPLAGSEFVREALGMMKLRADVRAEHLSVAELGELYRRLIPE